MDDAVKKALAAARTEFNVATEIPAERAERVKDAQAPHAEAIEYRERCARAVSDLEAEAAG